MIVDVPLFEGLALDVAVTVIVLTFSSAATCSFPAGVMTVPLERGVTTPDEFVPKSSHDTVRSKNPDPLTTACRMTLPPLTVFAVAGVTITDVTLTDELAKVTAGANGDILKIYKKRRNEIV